MNEIHRIGKGDEYIEICCSFEGDYTDRFSWWFKDLIAGNQWSNKNLIKSLKEVIQFLEDRVEDEEND